MITSSCAHLTSPQVAKAPREDGYLFVMHSMEIGGVESLAIRMANDLVQAGATVFFLCPPGPMCGQINPTIRLLVFSSQSQLTGYLRNLNPPPGVRTLNIWYSIPNWLFRFAWLPGHMWSRYKCTTKSTSGIFHPNQIHRYRVLSIQWVKSLLFLHLLLPGSVYFMNVACKAAHQARLGRIVASWPIHQIYIPSESTTLSQWQPTSRTPLKIVSIGRIVRFKAYNYSAASMVRSLQLRNVPVEWHIYGDGDDLAKLKQDSHECGPEGCIQFHGALPYSQFEEVVLKFDLFVGMGTAALEAARTGLPTLLAIESMEHGCYGFLHQAPLDSIGERIPSFPVKSLIDEIEQYYHSDNVTRLSLSHNCKEEVLRRSTAQRGSITEIFDNAPAFPQSFRWRQALISHLQAFA